MDELSTSIEAATGLGPELQLRIFESALILVLLVLARALVTGIVWRRTEDPRIRYRWRKVATYTAAVLGVLLIGRIWFRGFQSPATFLGLLGAGLAVALKDVVADMAGWLFILWRRPFSVGDRIQIGDHAGDVIDLRLFQFTLLEIGNWVDADQSTGRVIHVPNGRVFVEPVANYIQGLQYLWNEIPVHITFESNWRKAKDILLEVAERHGRHLTEDAKRRVIDASRDFMISYEKLTPTVYTRVKGHAVVLTIRYLCEPRKRRGSEQAIWEEILAEFEKHDDIMFAYPTQRFFDNVVEGKPGVRGGMAFPETVTRHDA